MREVFAQLFLRSVNLCHLLFAPTCSYSVSPIQQRAGAATEQSLSPDQQTALQAMRQLRDVALADLAAGRTRRAVHGIDKAIVGLGACSRFSLRFRD